MIAAFVWRIGDENHVAKPARIQRDAIAQILRTARMPGQSGQPLCKPDKLKIRQVSRRVPAARPRVVSFAAECVCVFDCVHCSV